MLRKATLLSAVVLLAGFASAQSGQPTKVQVGDSVVNGGTLKPYKNLWKMSRISPDGKEYPDAGTWSDQLQFVRVKGHNYLQRTQEASFKQNGTVVGTTKTINVFEPRTMAPISRSFTKHVAKGGDETTQIEFRNDSFHWTHTTDGRTSGQDVKLEAPVFDFYGGLYGILICAFPLKPGFSASFPSIDEDNPTVSWVTFRITGQELVDAGPKGRVNTLIAESDTNLGPMKFWLSKQAPYIIRLEYKSKDNGLTWIYEMI